MFYSNDEIKDNFIKVVHANQLLTPEEFSTLHAIYRLNSDNFFATILQLSVLDNNRIIDILHNHCNIPLIQNFETQVTIQNFSMLRDYVEKGYFLFFDNIGQTCIAVTDVSKFDKRITITDDIKRVYLIKRQGFYSLLEQNFRQLNLSYSKHNMHLDCITARDIGYKKAIASFIIMFCSLIYFFPNFFYILNNLSYSVQNILKCALFAKALLLQDKSLKTIYSISQDLNLDQTIKIDANILQEAITKRVFGNERYTNTTYNPVVSSILPIYTILVPLYKEPEKLRSILAAIDNLNYPKDKLDVKIIIEEDDVEVIYKLYPHDSFPPHIQIIIVPFGLPRTKPKALNYAMNYARGKFLVIYDAEDIPDKNQLIDSVKLFEKLPEEYICLQAKLNFYNRDENLLAKFFSLEYGIWFNYLIKGLELFNLPIPLGGTSNHFKTEALRKVGLWDSYNVTEDADLGIRLYLNNYRVKILDSLTLEEAPIYCRNWLKQRSRWIKGFIQTLLVFCAQPNKTKKLTIIQICSVFILFAVANYSFYIMPWLLIYGFHKVNSLGKTICAVNIIFAFSYAYSNVFHILITTKNSVRNFTLMDWVSFVFYPFYFILHTIACYKAILELIIAPFRWNKTKHGDSKP